MGTQARIDAHLAAGGIVLASSERAARALTAAYHRARQNEGLSAWPAPDILHWESFIRAACNERAVSSSIGGRMVLNAQQEQSLWAEIAARHGGQAWLSGPLHRIAALAMDAHRLLCSYAPRFLHPAARDSWQQDAAAFSRWLAAFEEVCRAEGLLSSARLPLELVPLLQADSAARPPLLLAGFDRTLPIQSEVFAAWGPHEEAPHPAAAPSLVFYQAPDEAAELAACALWCKQRLNASPQSRLLVIAQDAAERRGEIERAFLRVLDASEPQLLEFSLGIPLQGVSLGRGALLVLRWLAGPLEESELDWLISTGQLAAVEDESRALAAYMHALRRKSLERTAWSLDAFLSQKTDASLSAAWAARMAQARQRLDAFTRQFPSPRAPSAQANPLAWAELVPQLLRAAGWPGGRALSSAEFQAVRRWEQALDACASLGFSDRRMEWSAFLAALERTLEETLFSPESEDAPVLVAGPAESAGLEADGIWFLGASEDAWPAAGAAHPFLPLDVQREAAMPHASAQLDWSLAESVTHRLLASAPEICFSFARMSAGVQARPSRLILNDAGAPQSLPAALVPPLHPGARTEWFQDLSQVPFPSGLAPGGSSVLTAQSQCAFKAFAVARLGAEKWEAAQPGLTPLQRGALLHEVLRSIWSGPPRGVRSHADLLAKLDTLEDFVRGHVSNVCASKMPAPVRATMPPAYLTLEEARLAALLVEWLRYESERVPFTVAETELKSTARIGDIELHLRLDRVDRLNDDSLLVIDYKSGGVSPKLWDLPRPDDVQLPQYACFGLNAELRNKLGITTEDALAGGYAWLGGLAFAKVRPGEMEFAGHLVDARTTLRTKISGNSNLVRKPLTQEQLADWKEYIEGLALDFLAGRAFVNPRAYPETCEDCGLHILCRVHELKAQVGDGSASESEASSQDD
jgi:ATP-dependent helicase/nuclease subunit B